MQNNSFAQKTVKSFFGLMRFKWHWLIIAYLFGVCIIQVAGYWSGVLSMVLMIFAIMPIVENQRGRS